MRRHLRQRSSTSRSPGLGAKRWRRLVVLTMAVLLVPVGTGRLPAALACSCAAPAPGGAGDELAGADVVFDGVAVQRIEPVLQTGLEPVTWRFDVQGVLKGAAADPQDVLTGGPSDTCAAGFQLGRAYRVFARRGKDGVLSTHSCSGNQILSGYRMAAADGGVFAFGTATFHGSAGGLPLQAPVVGIAATPSGRGYWLAAADGGVFAYGDAPFHGSAGGLPLRTPVVGITASPTGQGYWLAAADGGVFAFGDARFKGSAAGLPLAAPVVGIAATGSGAGYWLLGGDAGVFAYGDAPFLGRPNYPVAVNLPSPTPPRAPGPWVGARATGITATHSGTGYWITDHESDVRGFGDTTPFGGEPPGEQDEVASLQGYFWDTVGVARTSTAPALVIANRAGAAVVFNASPFGGLNGVALQAQIVAVSA